MKTSELKIGDLIKYKTPDTINKHGYVLTTGHIKEIFSNYLYVHADSLIGSVYCVLFENIVAKLKPIINTKYEEIKIDNTEQPISKYRNVPPSNIQYCEDCGKSSLSGIYARYYYLCYECEKNRDKSTKNSNFKFDIDLKGMSINYNRYDGGSIELIYSNLVSFSGLYPQIGKTYTVEIKEKNENKTS